VSRLLSDDEAAVRSVTDPTAKFDPHQSAIQRLWQNDAGLFETNLRDERYLPFEGTGTISRWHIKLPAAAGANAVPQFDLDTIADVILHIRYTARDGGQVLRDAALQNLRQRIDVAETIGSVVLLSARHDFPTEWARFTSHS